MSSNLHPRDQYNARIQDVVSHITNNLGSILMGLGLILLLALVTRGNLRGKKTSPV